MVRRSPEASSSAEGRSAETPGHQEEGERVWCWREADKAVVASILLAGRCERSHDLVAAGFEPGDRERFLKERKWGRIPTHRMIVIYASPLRIHRVLRPVSAAMEAGRNKARRPTH